MARRWSDLSDRTRKLILVAAVIEGGLKAAALLDLSHRPASQVRGPKWAWSVAMLVNSAGIVPLCYLFFGRQQAVAGS
jgi:hypothetical protein